MHQSLLNLFFAILKKTGVVMAISTSLAYYRLYQINFPSLVAEFGSSKIEKNERDQETIKIDEIGEDVIKKINKKNFHSKSFKATLLTEGFIIVALATLGFVGLWGWVPTNIGLVSLAFFFGYGGASAAFMWTFILLEEHLRVDFRNYFIDRHNLKNRDDTGRAIA